MWRAVYDTTTGRLLSVGSIHPEQYPPNTAYIDLGEAAPDLVGMMWDEATHAFVTRPAKVLQDRLQDIITNGAYADDAIALWNALNANNRTRLRNGLIRLLGHIRYRAAGESIEIDRINL